METLHDILSDIKQHTEKEWACKARNKSIARSCIKLMGKSSPERIWLCNRGYQATRTELFDITGAVGAIRSNNVVDIYDKDGTVTNKNLRQGRILLENKSGKFSCVVPRGTIEFEILDRSSYRQYLGDIFDVRVDLDNMTYSFSDIVKGLKAAFRYKESNDGLEEIRKAKERLKEEERLRLEKEKEIERKRQIELQKVRDAEQKKVLEERQRLEREREEKQRLEAEAKEQEKKRQLEEEAEKLEASRDDAFNKYTHALSFIRSQATLRNNPILDSLQNDIKFSHVLDGATVVIDGGPGTGKTTTLIQRLKLLISEDALIDYRLNEQTCKLTDAQIKIVTDERNNWMFFSPNELLLQYLRSNMQYEGLDGLLSKTVVWEDHLKRIIRNDYMFAGSDCPFEFKRKNQEVYTSNHLEIVKDFMFYYTNKQKDRLINLREADYTKITVWKEIADKVVEICSGVETLDNLSAILHVISRLEELQNKPFGDKEMTVKDLIGKFNQSISRSATLYLVEWKKDEVLYEELRKLINDWKKPLSLEDSEEDDEEDDEEENNLGHLSVEDELLNPLKSLLQKLALNSLYYGKEKISGKVADLSKIVKDRINISKLKELGEIAYLKKTVARFMRRLDSQILQVIPSTYKEFRKKVLADKNPNWNLDTLDEILRKYKNKVIFEQEQALLLGFINNVILALNRFDSNILNNQNGRFHKYVDAYKNCRIPVIGIDECTDYSLIDYYAIASLRDNRVSSVTLSGDIMQCMKEDGINKWDELRNKLIFNDLYVGELKISYRQSPELLSLAEFLYQITMRHPSPYKCYISSSEVTPRPLWFDSDDIEEKAEWIASRILEVHKAYGQIPSIAIFTKDEDTAKELHEALEDISDLENAGIDIFNCSGSNVNLKERDTVRIFTINNVKGMEFDVVFFYDIDDISDNPNMINKYLYVALSRAAFFMAVTSNNTNGEISSLLKNHFVVDGDWSSIIDLYKDKDLIISDNNEE